MGVQTMPDTKAAIGARIRARRQACGLTQQALAEGIVTRNMLSQIENGLAMPSVRSLEAFAERLSVKAGWLLSGGGDELYQARQAFSIGDNETAIALALDAPSSAERQLLCCQAYCRAANTALALGNADAAKKFAQACLEYCDGVYDNAKSKLSALRILAITALLGGDGEDAVLAFHTAHSAEAIEAKHNLVMAKYYLDQENLSAAEHAIWSITTLPDEQKGIYLLLRGKLALRQEKRDAAQSFLKQAEAHGVPYPFLAELNESLKEAFDDAAED